MEWPAVRPILQGMVPRNYWTALECHDDGAWTAYTPGLPVDGGALPRKSPNDKSSPQGFSLKACA